MNLIITTRPPPYLQVSSLTPLMLSKSSTPSPSVKGLSEALRLQSETEYFTRRLETEKRRSMMLDQEIAEAKAVFTGRKRHLRELNERRQREPAQLMRMKRIEETIRAYEVKINQAQTENRDIRRKIDSFRKLKLNSECYKIRLNLELEKVQSQAYLAKADTERMQGGLKRNMSSLTQLKDDMMISRSRFSETSKSLTSRIEREKWQRTQDLEFMQGMTSSLSKAEVTEGLILSRHLLKRWKRTVKDHADTLFAQQERSRLMQLFFETVKEQSAITELDEVVRVVRKFIEDETVLTKYNSTLLEEIEKIKLELTKAQLTIAKRMEGEAMTEEQLLARKEELTKDLTRRSSRLDKCETHLVALEVDLSNLTTSIEQLKALLAPWLSVHEDWEDQVTLRNIVRCVKNLEDQFTVLLTAGELQRKAPHPELAMLDLASMASASSHLKRSELMRQVNHHNRKLKEFNKP